MPVDDLALTCYGLHEVRHPHGGPCYEDIASRQVVKDWPSTGEPIDAGSRHGLAGVMQPSLGEVGDHHRHARSEQRPPPGCPCGRVTERQAVAAEARHLDPGCRPIVRGHTAAPGDHRSDYCSRGSGSDASHGPWSAAAVTTSHARPDGTAWYLPSARLPSSADHDGLRLAFWHSLPMIYRAAGPAMAFKLIQPAQDRWRAVNCWRSLQPARSRPSAAARWRPASSLSVIVAAAPAVACHDHGTTLRGFLPRAWDHPVASDGTTRRAGLGVLITSGTRCLQVDRLGGSGDGIPGGCRD
jgi:hypothetical protein